jgi:3D (Asp-Asp-Asp) domain-containing protein
MNRRGTTLLAALCCCMLAVPPVGGADPSPSIATLKADDAGLAAKQRAAVLDLYSLDARLSAAQSRLGDLRAQQGQLREERAVLVRELSAARVDSRLSQNRLAARLRFIYDHGTTTSLDFFMGASSIQEAISQLDDYDRIADADRDVLLQVRSTHGRLVRLRGTLASREHALSAATASAAATVAQLQQLHTTRTAYVDELVLQRSYDEAEISTLTAQAEAAVVRSEQLAAARRAPTAEPIPASLPAPSVPAPVVTAAAPASGATSLTVVATGYDLTGPTSSGLPVGWGVAAVDPSVIPLGTHLMVPGYGEAVAADTGPAIVGDTIDLWFPTAQQAFDWGRRTVTISVN